MATTYLPVVITHLDDIGDWQAHHNEMGADDDYIYMTVTDVWRVSTIDRQDVAYIIGGMFPDGCPGFYVHEEWHGDDWFRTYEDAGICAAEYIGMAQKWRKTG
jgi:hypothetical protein